MLLRHNHYAIPARVEKDAQVPAIPSTQSDTESGQPLFAGVLRLGGATLIGQAVALAAWPFLTRLYAPADIGVFVVYLALVNLIGTCACLRYELAIVLPRTLRGAASLVHVALVASLVITAGTALLVLVAGDQIATLLGLGTVSSVLWIVPGVVAARGIYQALNYWASRRRHTGVIALARIGQQTVAASVQIGAAFTALGGGIALALGHLAGITAACLAFLVAEGGALVRTYRAQAGRNVRRASAMAVRHRKFPRYDVPAALLNVAALELPVIFIAMFYSEALTGQFGLAVRVTGWPAAMATAALAQLYYPRANEEYLASGNAKTVTLESLRGLIRAGVPLYAGVVVLAPWLFAPVFGDEWRLAGVMASLLAPLYVTMFLVAPISQLFFVRGRQRAFLAYQAVYFAAAFAGLAVGALANDILIGVGLFSALATLRQLAMLVDMCRHEGIGFADLWRPKRAESPS